MSLKLIVALDFDDELQALALVDQLDPATCALKVGSELFTRFGATLVRRLIQKHFKVFLDLKFHDIPTTVALACKSAADLGVWMMNVHASGGLKMMCAAHDALSPYGVDRPLLIAVTVLTSMNEHELTSIGVLRTLTEQVSALAHLALDAGFDGVVSSALEVPLIKSVCGSSFLTVTPGIRMHSNESNDQSRITTPEQAIKAGSDYLVIGRPITRATSPMDVVDVVLNSFLV